MNLRNWSLILKAKTLMMLSVAFPMRRYLNRNCRCKPHHDKGQGFHFLYYLEKVVGKPAFDKFIPHYFTKWQKKSLDSYEFKSTLLEFFESDKVASKALAEVDWDSWFYKPGLPPKPEFDTSMVDKCYALADKWESQNVCHVLRLKESLMPVPHQYANEHLSGLQTLPIRH
jgi:hypothetical protein